VSANLTFDKILGEMRQREEIDSINLYEDELGQTTEQYYWQQLTSLLESEKPVLLDCEDGRLKGMSLLGCYDFETHTSPIAFWSAGDRHERDRFFAMEGNDLTDPYNNIFGVRTMVNLKTQKELG